MKEFGKLIEIVAALRDKDKGCPWDAKQTSESLVPNFIEELYEAVEAIEDADDKALCEELGDLLLHITFQAQIASEEGKFSMEDVLKAINSKLVRRHPHIFAEGEAKDAEEVKMNWERIKMQEKKERKSVLDGVPKTMPALIQSWRLQEKAASVGFCWDDYSPILAKIEEEYGELREALEKEGQERVIEELGDLLFSVVNLAYKLGIDAEAALKATNRKFYNRFRYVEEQYSDGEIEEASLEELDSHWEKSKLLK